MTAILQVETVGIVVFGWNGLVSFRFFGHLNAEIGVHTQRPI
jgi:hypothetical protein